jgi:hypothetical protein
LKTILGLMPVEMLFEAAPHLWEAEDRLELAKLMMALPTTGRAISLLLNTNCPSPFTVNSLPSLANSYA